MPEDINHDELLSRVYSVLDKLSACADKYNGLFPSIIDPKTGEIPFTLPDAIDGQRYCDRSFPGCNLMHDHTVLGLMYDLSEATGEERFAKAADRYLKYWSQHCTNTPTGLFPWGEHAFWHLEEDRIGSGYNIERVYTMLTHDHLLQAPVWLWEKLWQFNSNAVERFCIGLNGHFLDVENPPAYNRHANLLLTNRKRNRSGCDFPRHSGFHIMDWSFACCKIDSPMFRGFLSRSVDYWWDKKYENNTLPLSTTTLKEFSSHLPQTLSLAASLYESSELLKQVLPEQAKLMCERGKCYYEGFLSINWDFDSGILPQQLFYKTGEVKNRLIVWDGSYGSGSVAATALICLCVYNITGDSRLLNWAIEGARLYMRTEFPDNAQVPIYVPGALLLLLTDLYCITKDKQWLQSAEEQLQKLIPLYMRKDLPCGATGYDFYESQHLPGYLLRGAARLALLRSGKEIAPDYTQR